LTWQSWHVSPFITSVFFILGVFTLYQVLSDWFQSVLHNKKSKINVDMFSSWFGVFYMLLFIFSTQATVIGKSISWEFMNFQLIALVFCAYFLDIRIRYYIFFPIVLTYMIFNSSLGYWESWCHAATLISFYWSLNHVQRLKVNMHPFLRYITVGTIYGGLLWFFVTIKFSLQVSTFLEGWFYLVIFEILLYSYIAMLRRDSKLKKQLKKFANHDALTKTENYAAYESKIALLFNSNVHNKLDGSMMMFDIDHFKKVNDTYGHLAGDRVLQHTVDVVQTVIDENDPSVKLYRTGGEEFNVVFPGYDLNSTRSIVEEIFVALNNLSVNVDGEDVSISISIGVSTVSKKDITPDDFYNRVDGNLYRSKKSGRMKITAA